MGIDFVERWGLLGFLLLLKLHRAGVDQGDDGDEEQQELEILVKLINSRPKNSHRK